MTYNVFGGTLNFAQSVWSHSDMCNEAMHTTYWKQRLFEHAVALLLSPRNWVMKYCRLP